MGQAHRRPKTRGFTPTCSICMECMGVEDASVLRCGHLFHFHCIKYWLTEQDTCPECRKQTKLDEVVTQLYVHNETDDKKDRSSDPDTDSDSSDDSEKLDNYDELLKKLGDAYVELEKEKAKHEVTKDFLDKVQQEKVQLINKIVSVNTGRDQEAAPSTSRNS